LRQISFEVYADGIVRIDYSVDVDPTRPRINVSLIGSILLDVFIEDQDGLPLDYIKIADGVSIETLGSALVYISYSTPDLTNKSGHTWVFSVSTPVTSNVLLPEESAIVNLNRVPLSMSSIDERLLLIMPSGYSEVSYTIGIVGTRSHAIAVIRDAESTLDQIEDKGTIISDARNLLLEAYSYLDSELYVEAEELAKQAKSSAEEADLLALEAYEAMNEASTSIDEAEKNGRSIGLEEAKQLLQQAQHSHSNGNYSEAIIIAENASSAAEEAVKPEEPDYRFIIAIVTILLASVSGIILFRARQKREKPSRFDLEAIFEEHPHLRYDDKEVIRFLVKAGGKAFATEIRERFDVPRTSLWRMLRRLQREGLIEVENIGGQNLARLRSNNGEDEKK
jgi:uncharacterized membrane protein